MNRQIHKDKQIEKHQTNRTEMDQSERLHFLGDQLPLGQWQPSETVCQGQKLLIKNVLLQKQCFMYFCDFGDLHIIVRCKMQNSFSSDQQDEANAAPALHGFLPNLQLWPETSPVACIVSYRYVH